MANTQAAVDALSTQTPQELTEQQLESMYEKIKQSPIVVRLEQKIGILAAFLIGLIIILAIYWIYFVFIVQRVDGEYVDPSTNKLYTFETSFNNVKVYQGEDLLMKTKIIDGHVFVNEEQGKLLLWYNNLVMFYNMEDLKTATMFVKRVE